MSALLNINHRNIYAVTVNQPAEITREIARAALRARNRRPVFGSSRRRISAGRSSRLPVLCNNNVARNEMLAAAAFSVVYRRERAATADCCLGGRYLARRTSSGKHRGCVA